MRNTLASILLAISLVACGGTDTDMGMEPGETCTSNLASLGIDPLGRGDGIDITLSNYDGRCYEDDALEANRPQGPDPRIVAADEAAAKATESYEAAHQALIALDAAKQALEDSYSLEEDPPAGASQAWNRYVTIVTVARFGTEEAYQIGLALLSPEASTTWEDLVNNPDEGIQVLASVFLDDIVVLFESPALVDLAVTVLTEVIKAEMLDFLKEARDLAKSIYDALPAADQVGPEMLPTADPAAMQALEEAQIAYDEAQAQATADGHAALEASDLVHNTPSDLAPCDSEELRYMLQTTVCDVPFENPVSAEEEADVPGLSQAIEDYITELCTAVELVCELEE